MAPPYGEVHERAWPPRAADGRPQDGLASQFSFMESSRISNSLGNLRIWMCQKCGEESKFAASSLQEAIGLLTKAKIMSPFPTVRRSDMAPTSHTPWKSRL